MTTVDRDAVRDAAVEQTVRAQHAYEPALVGTVFAAHCRCGWMGVDRYYTEDSARTRTVEHVEAVVAEALAQAGAAPLIVAAELERLADAFDTDAREVSDRVQDHADGGNKTGASIAIVTAEVYEAMAERLRDRATELRGGAL